MYTKADFCTCSYMNSQGKLYCPSNCSHRNYRACDDAIKNFTRFMVSRNKKNSTINKNINVKKNHKY